MCLIAIAHRVSERFPLVIAANRDEDYDRPTVDAALWEDAPDVVGGRDVLHGGSWLAVTRGGRFAAVTNLRGAVAGPRSRGALVRDFVTSDVRPEAFAESVSSRAGEYSGFHLIAGEAGGDAMYVSPEIVAPLNRGIFALSNGAAGEEWPKVALASDALQETVSRAGTAESVIAELLQFLGARRGSAEIESEVFITGEQYGTRASAVIVASVDAILFAERTYTRGGVVTSGTRIIRLAH